MTEEELRKIAFRIGMDINLIAQGSSDTQLAKMKPYLDRIDENVCKLVEALKEEMKSRARQEFIEDVGIELKEAENETDN